MSIIKSLEDQKKLRFAGSLLAEVVQYAFDHCTIGMTGIELDALIGSAIRERGCTPSFLGYEGYPAASCLSINEQVVHGIPTLASFREGDVIGIDIGLWHGQMCVDSAVTKALGVPDLETARLLAMTKNALKEGIRAIKPYRRVGSISAAIQAVAGREGLGIVRALTGHGVGHHVHEAPDVPNYGLVGDGTLLKPGMVLAIEPMFTLGNDAVETQVDGWGVVTADGSISAHFEHTVLITTHGAEILTKTLANA